MTQPRQPVTVRRRASVAAVTSALLGTALVLAACGTSRPPGGSAAPPPTTGPLRTVAAQPLGPDGALACPPSVREVENLAVPSPPQGVDGNARLLPARDPASVVVCTYPTLQVMAATPLVPPFRLGTRTVASAEQRHDVVDLLTWAPRWNGLSGPCTAIGGDETAYLVGARYTDAVVWVASTDEPNGCSRSSNGDFTSGAALGRAVRDVMAGTPAPSVAPCDGGTPGRLGDDRSLAPDGRPAVTVCRVAADGTSRGLPLGADRSDAVVAALRALTTRPNARTCEPASGAPDEHRFHLLLDYAEGPSVRVDVDPGCTPQVLGSGLQAEDAGDLVALVERWSPPLPGPDPDAVVSSEPALPPDAPGTSR